MKMNALCKVSQRVHLADTDIRRSVCASLHDTRARRCWQQRRAYVLVLVEVDRAGHSGQAGQQGSQHDAHAATVHHHAAAAEVLAVIHKAMHRP